MFIKIKQLFIDFKIDVDFKKISIMTDFEKGVRKALKEVFDGTPLYGCYFHFIKNLWEKAKQFGLFKRDLRKKYFYNHIFNENVSLFTGGRKTEFP